MKLQEAIKVQTALIKHGTEILSTPELYALKLSNGAMKRVKAGRRYFPETAWQLLPGETEE